MLKLMRTMALPLALLSGTALVGCQQAVSTINTQVPQYATDVQNIAAALQAGLAGVPNLPAQVTQDLAMLQQDAAQIAAAAKGGTTPTALIGSFGQVVTAILGQVGVSASTNATLATIIQAVSAVLPTILAVGGVALAPAASASAMSVDQARAVLLAASRR